MEGSERAQEARGGGGGKAGQIETNSDPSGGGTVLWIAGVAAGPNTEFVPNERGVIGSIHHCRGGGDRVRACCGTVFVT